jgi:hypothetical protein
MAGPTVLLVLLSTVAAGPAVAQTLSGNPLTGLINNSMIVAQQIAKPAIILFSIVGGILICARAQHPGQALGLLAIGGCLALGAVEWAGWLG